MSSGTFGAIAQDGTDKVISSNDGKAVNDGNWHHVVAVYNKTTNLLTRYVDGLPTGKQDSITSINSVSNDETLDIGISRTTGVRNTDPFNGQIDEVKIFNYALTPLQVKTEYNDGSVRFGP